MPVPTDQWLWLRVWALCSINEVANFICAPTRYMTVRRATKTAKFFACCFSMAFSPLSAF